MSGQDDGGHAFPIVAPVEFQFAEPGMSLRDWFAGQALNGLCAAPDIKDPRPEQMARYAYNYADEMIAEREKRNAAKQRTE